MKRIFFALCTLVMCGSVMMSQSGSKAGQSKTVQPPSRTTQAVPPNPAGAASVSPPTASPAADNAANSPDDFVIGAEDVLEMKVWREPDFNTRAVVRPDGKFGVTLLGDVQASGLTPTKLAESIKTKLTKFVEEPEVSIVVVEIHSQYVHLIGAVARPGAYALGGPLTVVELLARAGGVAEGAKAEEIAIIRTRGGTDVERIPFNYKAYLDGKHLQRNILLKNGDVVVVR